MIDFFKLHVSDYGEALLGMSDEDVGKIMRGLLEYSMDKDITPIDNTAISALFTVMKLHIDRDEEFRKTKARNGLKGGAPFGNNNSTKNNQKQPKSTKNNQKQPPIPIPCPIPIPDNNSPTGNIEKEINKERYGEFDNVLLTIDEFMKLKDKFPTDYQDRIENLSQYIAKFPDKASKYKSHYATILS